MVVLTGRDHLEDVLEVMDAGADSFIQKPVGLQELKARLRPGLRMLDLQRQLIEAREEYRHQASHDALTGLLSRKAVLDAFRTVLEAGPAAVAMVDVDHFKRVNDTFGHEAGDQVLQQVADQVRYSVRPEDHLGRLGGEEFLVVLPGCAEEDGKKVAERLRAQVEGTFLGDGGRRVTVSVGVAAGDSSDRYADLLRTADRALYAAKKGERNQVVVASAMEKVRSAS